MRAYRLPERTILGIERLSKEWECTHGEVIERLIAEVAGNSQPNVPKNELKVEYDDGS